MASFAVDNAPNSGGNATHARTLDPSIIPGSSFDTGVEFTSEAMPPECRAMYADRSTEHTMMVRGPTYLDDKAKIFGGEAMAKLLCMDVFEVTSGDRHDHLACRGAAKRRLDALRTLPDDLFFLIVNHQIPGTPPVSLAAYFALPLNLQERHPEPETAAFMRLFAKFIDAPRGEEERLAAWGLAPASSSSASAEPATPGAGGDDGDGDDEGGNGSGCSTPADPASPGVKKGLFGLLSRGAQRLREIRDVTWPTASDVGTLPPTDFRNARFKLVPSISEGPWVAKSAVGSTPTLLGKKVRGVGMGVAIK
jgi:hypothetical protein